MGIEQKTTYYVPPSCVTRHLGMNGYMGRSSVVKKIEKKKIHKGVIRATPGVAGIINI